MGNIKDIFDLLTQLSKRSKDREIVAGLIELQVAVQGFITQLQSENFQLKKENLDLKQQLFVYKKENEILKQKLNEQSSGDVCPFCRRPAGNLLKIEPHQIFGDVGVKTGYYKCGNCQKEYDREIQP